MVGAVAIVGLGKLQFITGGVLVNLGYRMQDHLAAYDFEHEHATPQQIWDEFVSQNHMAASVRSTFPRTARHPVIALVTCMDARLDTNEIAGDTRRYYYVLRLAGSALAVKDEEMLELAVNNGVKVVVFTTHTECAAEKVAGDPKQREMYPELTRAVDNREAAFKEFLARPAIAKAIGANDLIVKWVDLDTRNEWASPHKEGSD